MQTVLQFSVNGRERTVTTDPRRPLLDVLREDLGLTGAKYGCGEGECGACTVLVDGRPVRSCVTAVQQVDGRSVVTIEGLAQGDSLHPVQTAFLDEGAIQCGYCTSGMILSATALLDQNSQPTDEQIVDKMNGHICRCNGYPKIVSAIRRAAAARKGQES